MSWIQEIEFGGRIIALKLENSLFMGFLSKKVISDPAHLGAIKVGMSAALIAVKTLAIGEIGFGVEIN